MKSLIKSMLSAMSFLSTPFSSRLPRKAFQDGSILEETYPFSASKPRCAMCLKDPSWGPEIRDLSIFPPFDAFLLFSEDEDLARKRQLGQRFRCGTQCSNELTFNFLGLNLLAKRLCFFFISKDKADHALL
jgi:hypothetical protein